MTFERLPAGLRNGLRDEPVPRWRPPMLATLTEQRFSHPGWIFERKLDGIRCLAYRDGDQVRLLSRNQQPLDTTFPEVRDAVADQAAQRFVVDGEVVALEGRRTSFARLQGRSGIHDAAAARASEIAVYYYVFDVLHLGGVDATHLPLTWRKRLVRRAITFSDPLRYTTHRVQDGEAAYRQACARGDEGVIAKRADAEYAAGRSSDWLKFKCVRDQEFVIGGFTAPKGSRVGLGALLVGYHDDGDLVYAGKVGTGYTEDMLRRLRKELDPLVQDRSPFDRGRPREAATRWVRPELVGQVAFTEWTRDGRLRHPRFQGLRTDKRASDVVRETP